MQKIKNIIFDFGGVILNIDHKRLENAFRKLDIPDFDSMFSQASQSTLFQDFEKGLISNAEFRDQIRDYIRIEISDEMLDHTWNQIIGDYPKHRIDLLKNIQDKFKTYILSNTNSIHYDKYIKEFMDEYGFDFPTLFTNTYWSFQFGKRKPDPDPFLHILQQENIKPGETLFIDDSIQNIIIARKLNIFAFHLTPETDVTELFDRGYLKESILEQIFLEHFNQE
jgi:putative hydrolase of the HAD superfamily